ncbi:hypothetical protein FRB98_002408 [Tulasnella sp. 332]|nr:hypothetical protein FRB98_002408 [Tulasnella sp. 332]
MAQSLCEMFLRSPNKDFTQQGKTIFESLREKRRAAVERAWYDLENLKTRSNAPAVPFRELKELRGQTTLMIEDVLEEGDGASTEEEFVDVTSTLGGLDDYPLHHFDEGEEDSQHGLPNDDAATHIAMLQDRPSQLMLSDHNCLFHETKESSQSPPLEFIISEEPFHSGSPVLDPNSQGNPSEDGTFGSQMSDVRRDLRDFKTHVQNNDAMVVDLATDTRSPELGIEPPSELDSPLLLTPRTPSSPISLVGYPPAHPTLRDLRAETEMASDTAVQMVTESQGTVGGVEGIEIDGTNEWGEALDKSTMPL